jgi:hypothetical protein
MEEEGDEILGARFPLTGFVKDLVRFILVHQNGSSSISLKGLTGGCLKVTFGVADNP